MDKFDKINDQIDKAMLKPYAEEIDAEIKKYRKDSENYNECIELKALIKNSPKNKTVFIKNDEDFFSQLPSFFTQIGQGRDKYTRERTELVKSIKDQLTIPEIQKDDHNSNGQILHVEFNGKLDQDEIMQNKFSIKELGDIASVQIKNYDNDCREIDGKILTLYKKAMSGKLEIILKRIENEEKLTENLERRNKDLKKIKEKIVEDIEDIKAGSPNLNFLSSLPTEKFPKFHKKVKSMLKQKAEIEEWYDRLGDFKTAIKSLSPEEKELIVNYDPKKPIIKQLESINKQFESKFQKQLGNPL